jgi:hypothetical protein
VEVPLGYGVTRVVIEVNFTGFVTYVTFFTCQYSTLTVSWITKQQFVGSVEFEAGAFRVS